MKTFTTKFRGKKVRVIFKDSQRGIMLSWVGSNVNLADSLTKQERNKLIIECFNA